LEGIRSGALKTLSVGFGPHEEDEMEMRARVMKGRRDLENIVERGLRIGGR